MNSPAAKPQSLKVKLYCGFYQDPLPERHAENLRCLANNAENDAIDEIWLFVDVPDRYRSLETGKIKIVASRQPRCTYQDFIEHANSQPERFILLMCNTDIYFDQSLKLVKSLDYNRSLYCLGRREVQTDRPAAHTEHYQSSDVWILQTPVRPFFSDIQLGLVGCESSFLGHAQRGGYKLKNIGLDIAAYHLHITQKRNINPLVDRYTDFERAAYPELSTIAPVIQERHSTGPIVFDAAAFQYNSPKLFRTWMNILAGWISSGFAKDLVILDRAGLMPKINGLRLETTAAHNLNVPVTEHRVTQNIFRRLRGRAFLSSMYTTARRESSVCVIYDLVPEELNANLELYAGRHQAFYGCDHLVVPTNYIKGQLLEYYPDLNPANIHVISWGVQSSFKPSSAARIANFRQQYQLNKPYFVFVGDRQGICCSKNLELLVRAIGSHPLHDQFQLVFVGGQPQIENSLVSGLSPSQYKRLSLEDDQLIDCLSGAAALLEPSLAAGLPLSVIEAMRCGCPVIGSNIPALQEVTGGHAILIDPSNPVQLLEALSLVQLPQVRSELIEAGSLHTRKFCWSNAADQLAELMRSIA